MGVSKRQMQNFLIYVLDMAGLTVGYFIAVYLRFGSLKTAYGYMRTDMYIRWFSAMAVLTFVYLLFHPNRGFFKRKITDEIRNDLLTAILTGAGMSMVAMLMADASKYSRFIYMFTIGFEFFYMIIAHRLYRKYWLRRRANHSYARKMMIITTSDEAEKVISNIIKEKTWDLWITSIVIIDKNMTGQQICGIPVVGFTYRSMFEYAARYVVDEVFMYIPRRYKYPVAMTIQNFEDMGINTSLNIPLFEINQKLNKSLDRVGSYNVVTFSGREASLFMLILKRAMDILGGLVGMLITGIALIFVAPAVKLESPGPLFFSQKRVGRNGRIFNIYKIRSMYQDAEERKKELMKQNEMKGLMFKMENDPRIIGSGADGSKHGLGWFIRKTSLDEFPQFWNVLKGDMSLVGTRPPTVDEWKQYEPYHRGRLAVKPGLTGMWQVSGRSDITDFEEVVKLDMEYVKNWNIGMDIKILFKTVGVVLKGSGSK